MKNIKFFIFFFTFFVATHVLAQDKEASLSEDLGQVEDSGNKKDKEEAPLDEVFNQVEKLNEEGTGVDSSPFIYSEKGRRDPFLRPGGLEKEVLQTQEDEQLSTGLEGYDLGSFRLTAVMWDVKYPKALVKASEKEIYVIEEGTKIGRRNGYVAKIREGEVVIVEPAEQADGAKTVLYKTQVLKLGR